jgi:hypothetical protein
LPLIDLLPGEKVTVDRDYIIKLCARAPLSAIKAAVLAMLGGPDGQTTSPRKLDKFVSQLAPSSYLLIGEKTLTQKENLPKYPSLSQISYDNVFFTSIEAPPTKSQQPSLLHPTNLIAPVLSVIKSQISTGKGDHQATLEIDKNRPMSGQGHKLQTQVKAQPTTESHLSSNGPVKKKEKTKDTGAQNTN